MKRETMKLELHVLQNFAPSNLNRDDTGAPKDCEFGGYRRARISSQCYKRAVRQSFELDKLLGEDELAARTKRLVAEVADELKEKYSRDRETALAVAMGALEGQKLKRSDKGGEGDERWKTQYLLFVPRKTIAQLAAVLDQHWDELAELAASKSAAEKSDASDDKSDKSKKGRTEKSDKKKEKAKAKSEYPKEVGAAVSALLQGARGAVDLALFGRMIADAPEFNVDAACQVAHAISTNRVQMDFDFFTAVDDFKPNDNAGSDMMGTVQFNSSCFYRYAVLDVGALYAKLEKNAALTTKGVEAFVKAFVSAIPTGKQNGTAAHNFPSYVMAVVSEGGPSLSLANAFLKPARPRGEDVDIVDDSIAKLEAYAARLGDVGANGLKFSWADREQSTKEPVAKRCDKLSELYSEVTALVAGAQ
jgi:CRISPR system Cascade subunit CasC